MIYGLAKQPVSPRSILTTMRFKIKDLYIKIMLSLFSTVVALLLLEIALRILSPMSPFGPYFDLRPYEKLQLYPDLKGVSSPVWHTANKWGMRGDEPPSNWGEYYTILTIGGSTTQCFYLDDKKTWPYLLQEKLNRKYPKIWVGNAGIDGHSTRGHLLMMDKVLKKLKPDAIILLVGGNDLGISLSANAVLHGNLWDNKYKAKLNKSIDEHSRLLQILYIWKQILIDKVPVVRRIGHGNYVPEKMNTPESILPDLRDMLPSLSNFKENIVNIINMAKSLNIRTIFLTQPSLYEDNQYWSQILARSYWIKNQKYRISAATQWRMLEIFNHELIRICKEQEVECFDLALQIPHGFEYFYDPFHFTEKGAESVATEVATHMTKDSK